MSRGVIEAKTVILPPLPKPDADDVPEWSEETERALQQLTVIERSFVENLATGCNHAEAYRRASGVEYDNREYDTTRTRAYRFMSRPRVQAALHLAMKDMNFDARMDRKWILQRLEVALAKAEKESSGESAARILEIIARVKGEMLPPTQSVVVTHDITPAAKRLMDALELAKKKSGVIVVSRAEEEASENG